MRVVDMVLSYTSEYETTVERHQHPSCGLAQRRHPSQESWRHRLAALVGGGVRAGQARKEIHSARSGSRLVPLVSCDGRDHVQDARGHRAYTVEIHSGSRRSGFAPRLVESLRRLWLASHGGFWKRWQGDREAAGLHRTTSNDGDAESDYCGPNA